MSGDAAQDSQLPLVTIGVPVFNESAYLATALDSLIAQDYPNLEIVISDNASDDETEAICRQYEAADSRIRYHRMAQNVGAAENSNRIVDLATADFFLRASGHDVWSSNYVSACMDEMMQRPDAVIVFGSTRWIDAAEQPYPKETGWTDTRGMSTLERFFSQLWGNMHPIMGLARTEAIRRAMPLANIAAADLAFLLELSLMGDFIHAPKAIWHRREIRGPQSYGERMKRYKSRDYGLIKSRLGSVTPYARLMTRIPRIIVRSRISALEKAILLVLVYPTAIGRYVAARKRHDKAYERELAGP